MSNQILEPTPAPVPSLSAEERVTRGVLRQLGRPENLYRITAERVWDNRYRVNVYCSVETGHPVKTVSMTDSFFVTLTGEDITSSPEIVRRYE